ncbi:DUF5675 family protein [Parapedobacter sp. ISTM3]|uniref:DUF5675 family protein n=1 Tax=Parapedobacter sp. ISTM3 TaxID=2800130 RepID=UPI001F317F99|nr:DUF5675 family protein [Parapedobacter sp. ISTM3]
MMELHLRRRYYPEGTNGEISYQHRAVCACIELPWRGNRRFISCIPEGRYRLVKRMHSRWGEQLAVANVPGREGILIHPANDALTQLQGCIAPVTKCTAPGAGQYSRVALDRLKDLVYPVLDAGEEVWLVIVAASVVGRQVTGNP